MEELDNILAKYFSGEASPEEKSTVAQWRADHEEEYALLSASWQAMDLPDFDSVEQKETFDHKKAWEKVDGQLIDEEKDTRIIRLNFYKKVAAACAVLLVGLAGFWYINQGMVEHVSNMANAPQEMILPDGTKIWLAANSSLDYTKNFENDRSITLEGEAFFEVARDEAHPFVITTAMGEIEVLGTAFNVNSNENETTVSVDHGKVELRNEQGKQQLTANQEATATSTGITEVHSTDPNFKAWSDGVFIFQDETIAEIVRELNKHYEKQFVIDDEKIGQERIAAQFNDISFEEATEILTRLGGAEAMEEGMTVRLK